MESNSRNGMTEQPEKPKFDPDDHAHVVILPPLLYALAIFAGLFLNRIMPLDIYRFLPIGICMLIGVIFYILGIGLMYWSISEFKKFKTKVPPNLATTAIVTTGPYRLSRNPIYIAFNMIYAGFILWLGNGWLLPIWLIVLWIMVKGVIMREEAYLTQKFGDIYLAYAKRTRRWL